jgi:hypothetical protein
MAKQSLSNDAILRKDDEGNLWLMPDLRSNWIYKTFPVASIEVLLSDFNVRIGKWRRDEYSEYCLVTCLSREEMDTLHDGEEIKPTSPELEAFNAVLEANAGPNVLSDGLTQEVLVDLQSKYGPNCKLRLDQPNQEPEVFLVGEGYRPPMASLREDPPGLGIIMLHDFGQRGVTDLTPLGEHPGWEMANIGVPGTFPDDKELILESPQEWKDATARRALNPNGPTQAELAQKMSRTAEQVAAAEKILEKNGTPLVPVVVDGEPVQKRVSIAWTDGYKFKHTEEDKT